MPPGHTCTWALPHYEPQTESKSLHTCHKHSNKAAGMELCKHMLTLYRVLPKRKGDPDIRNKPWAVLES